MPPMRVVWRALRSQPVVEMHGRLPEWIAELKRIKDGGEQALFVAASPGRAERTIEILKEYEVFAAPIERAEEARRLLNFGFTGCRDSMPHMQKLAIKTGEALAALESAYGLA